MPKFREFDFERDFYGVDGYWAKKSMFTVKISALILAFIYYPYRAILDFFICIHKLDMFNLNVMIKKKRY